MSVDPDVATTDQPYVFTNDDPLNAEDPLGLKAKPKPTVKEVVAGGFLIITSILGQAQPAPAHGVKQSPDVEQPSVIKKAENGRDQTTPETDQPINPEAEFSRFVGPLTSALQSSTGRRIIQGSVVAGGIGWVGYLALGLLAA